MPFSVAGTLAPERRAALKARTAGPRRTGSSLSVVVVVVVLTADRCIKRARARPGPGKRGFWVNPFRGRSYVRSMSERGTLPTLRRGQGYLDVLSSACRTASTSVQVTFENKWVFRPMAFSGWDHGNVFRRYLVPAMQYAPSLIVILFYTAFLFLNKTTVTALDRDDILLLLCPPLHLL